MYLKVNLNTFGILKYSSLYQASARDFFFNLKASHDSNKLLYKEQIT
jgi:hypothetical protein